MSAARPVRVVGLIAALTATMGAGPLLTSTIIALSPLIVGEFELSGAQFGAIATTTFVTAALSSIVLQSLLARVGNRPAMLLVSLGSGLGVLLIACAFDPWWLFAAAAISGAAQGMSTPVTNRAIAIHLSGRAGTAIGIKQSGVQIAQLLAGLAFPLLAPALGWRGAALLGILAAFAGAALIVVFVPRGHTMPVPPAESTERARLPGLVWWLTTYSFAMGLGIQAINLNLPLFAQAELEFDPRAAGMTTAVAGGVGIAGRLLWSRAASALSRPARLLGVVAMLAMLMSIVLVLSAVWRLPALVWVAAIGFGATAAATNAMVMVVLIRSVPRQTVSSATGVTMSALYAGFAAGPPLFGVLVDLGSSVWAMSATTVTFASALAIAIAWGRSARMSRTRAPTSRAELPEWAEPI